MRDLGAAIPLATFVIDWPVLVAIGLVFGLVAYGQAWRSLPFYAGLVTCLAFTGAAIISYTVAPDWMWGYYIKPWADAPAMIAALVAYVAVFAGSFAIALRLRESEGSRGVWVALVLCGVAAVMILALTWDRYHLVGSAAEWHAGNADELLTTDAVGAVKTVSKLTPAFVVVAAVALGLSVRGRNRWRAQAGSDSVLATPAGPSETSSPPS
jgi:hypothetical protein